jgi:hypothetical protein
MTLIIVLLQSHLRSCFHDVNNGLIAVSLKDLSVYMTLIIASYYSLTIGLVSMT